MTHSPHTAFTLAPERWYACEVIGDSFDEDRCSYSPIRVLSLTPGAAGPGTLTLNFYHANYPEGVRDKTYDLTVIERTGRLLLVRSRTHRPIRLLQIYEIDWAWMTRHAGIEAAAVPLQQWLSANA